DFGAVGDGIADDTAAIQAAVNTGKTIVFPAGTYKQTSTVSAANVSIEGHGATIKGFNGKGFSVTNTIAVKGDITFEGYEDSANRENQSTNYTTSAIYFPTGSQIKYMRIGRNVKFYQCRSAVRFGSDSSDVAVDSTGNLSGPSWFFASVKECTKGVHLHCVYTDLEIAFGTYQNIIGSGKSVAAISCSMDNLIATSAIYDQTSKVHVHDITIDTVINRTTTGDSSPANTYECTGIRVMGRLIAVDNVIGKDVTGVNSDCELIYIKGNNFSVTNVLAFNCGAQEGAITLKGLDPTDTAGTSVPGGRGFINNIRIFFDNYTYNNNGTNVSLNRTGIAVNVPFEVYAGDNITIKGANSSSVVLNGQDADNANFTG
ncbi:MAG: glycosyl hydrolase family 28-related protein, partial [Candidatus Nanopelagicales bacterium]